MSSQNPTISFGAGVFPDLAVLFLFSTQKGQTESHFSCLQTQSHMCPHWKARLYHQSGKGLSLVSCALHLYQCVLTEHLLPSFLEGTGGIMWCFLLLVAGFTNGLKLWFPNFWTNGPLSTLGIPCRLSKHLADNSPWVGFSVWWWF